MFLNKLKLLIFFIQTINHSICEVDLNNITFQHLETLRMEYRNIMQDILQNHPYYIKRKNGVKYCPVPYSHAVDNEEVPYEGIEIINRELKYVVKNCVYEKKYALAYIIILNAIESIGLTYMYRFCEFAIEMNKKGASISDHLKEFSNNLHYKIIPIFNREWISPIPYDCILNVYKKHERNHENYKFTNVDEVYMSDLLDCKNLMKEKVNFISEFKNNITMDDLVMTQDYNNINIKRLLPNDFSGFKRIVGYKNQTLCTGCTDMRYSGTVRVIHIFLPCRHGWSCQYCNVLNNQCPVCHERITGTQVIQIETPTRIIKKGFLSLQPRCFFDGREARCISCRSQIKDVNPPNKYVMIPCGHGWYCSICIDSAICTKCETKFEDKLCVNL
ncbi:uncharacterized protein LOC126894372 isoform X3 [Daktulosphaira vitifoliae]|uniref:uncharacterized protein LOC126894372 isoform X3 n=1 Tax=Daktulosphaira vitifoliae TaxID=58002 RepID=UPI0021AA9F4B|nr:uncharacterized protein LOC126894372 isoform X3 [Daktulosphaira vitifoliae]